MRKVVDPPKDVVRIPVYNRDGLENNNHWGTPDKEYMEWDKEFNFDFDPCPLYHDLSKWDGLEIPWGNCNFVNPPYDRVNKPKFIRKAYEEWLLGKTSVLLIPSATGTRQFHELIKPHAEVREIKGRLAFKGYNTKGEYTTKNKGKHDSLLVIFRGKNHQLPKFEYIPKDTCEQVYLQARKLGSEEFKAYWNSLKKVK